LTTGGDAWTVLKSDCFFTIPNICPSDLATRCGVDPQAENKIQLHARVQVLKLIRTLQRDVENAMVGISTRLESIYETVRSRNPKGWSEITITEFAKIFHKNPTAVEVFAAHKVLLNDAIRFVPSLNYASCQVMTVRPLDDVKDLLQVLRWTRKMDPVVDQFIEKAAKVSEVQKRLAKETMAEEPGIEPAEHRWTTSDQTIIRFLKASLRPTRSVQMDPYEAPLTSILRRSFSGEEHMLHVDEHIHRLLVNIGVLSPWHDLTVLETSGLYQETPAAMLTEGENGILRALEKSKDPNPVHPDDFHPTDPLASIRHDWGDMPIYVIDSAGAEELDDGISVERIPSEPGNAWVHIHVADPASLIPRTNFLAQKAAQQHETLYLLPKSLPLFPKCITDHPTLGLSLGIRSRNGIPDNVITFSAKVDPEGSVLDVNVRAGLARNVKLLDYDFVDANLGLSTKPIGYPFGNAPVPPTPPKLDSRMIEDLKFAYNLMRKQRERRMAMNWFSLARTKAELARASMFPPDTDNCTDTTSLYRGFPKITYKVHDALEPEYGSRNLVAESMKLACRAASMWLLQNNVPAVRRCSNPMVPTTEEAIDTILNARNEIGYVSEQERLKDILYMPAAYCSTSPAMHWGLGVMEGQGYVRVTSPLRRYNDLVSHWQIHETLLQEKAGQKMKGAFDLEWTENFARSVEVKDQHLKTVVRRHDRYWGLLYIRRWQEMFADGKNRHLWPKDANGQPIPDPLHNLEGYLVSTPKLNRLNGGVQFVIQLPVLGLKEIMTNVVVDELKESYAEIGTKVPVRIESIMLGIKPLMMLRFDKTRKDQY
jgi:hypothetical protein